MSRGQIWRKKWLIQWVRERKYGVHCEIWESRIRYFKKQKEHCARIVITIEIFGSQRWVLNVQERIKHEVFERMCMRNICDIKKSDDRGRNSIFRERCSCELTKESEALN